MSQPSAPPHPSDESCCPPSERLDCSSVLRGLMSADARWRVERQLLLSTALSATALLSLVLLVSVSVWRDDPALPARLPLVALAALFAPFLAACASHFRAYRAPVPCSIGMMEGMTFGMCAGFVVGGLAGAANGMFWGTVFGLAAGAAAGVWAGRYGGVMGVLEGLMAGLMAGPMGAMLSVMLLAEPLPLVLALVVGVAIAILLGLSYMRLVEYGRLPSSAAAESPASLASTSLILAAALILFLVYGPQSGPVWMGG